MKITKLMTSGMILLNLIILPASANHLESKDQLLEFREIYIMETYTTGEDYLTGPVNDKQFSPYKWTTLPQNLEAGDSKIHVMKTFFTLAPEMEQEALSLYLGPADYPYYVYLNGELITVRGNTADGLHGSVFSAQALMIPQRLLDLEKENILVIECFSATEQAAIGGLYLGTNALIQNKIKIRDFWFHKFVLIMLTLTTILFGYFLYLFYARGGQKPEYLFFALTCLSFTFSTVNIALYHDHANSLLLAKMSRVGLILAVTFVWFFIIHFIRFFRKPRLLNILIHLGVFLLAAVFSVITILQKSKLEVYSFFNAVTSNLVITPMLVTGIILLLISFFAHKNKLALIVAMGLILLAATSIRDLEYLKSFRVPFYWGSQYGFTALVLFIFFTLAIEQANARQEVENHQQEINKRNDSLMDIMEKVQAVCVRLKKTQENLTTSITTSIQVVTEYDNNNSKLKEDAHTKFEEMKEIIDSVKQRIVASSENVPRAIINQTRTADKITSTIDGLNEQLIKILKNTEKTNLIASELSRTAAHSTGVVNQSKNFTTQIDKYARFIGKILANIDKIVESTNILATNAAIEATRVGGSGFHLVAVDIRKLAQESLNSLKTSFDKIKEMTKVISQSMAETGKVEENLATIIRSAEDSALSIKKIADLLEKQKTDSGLIKGQVTSFMEHTETIKRLSQEELGENETIESSLTEVYDTIRSIIGKIEGQMDQREELDKIVKDIQRILQENEENFSILNQSLMDNSREALEQLG